MNNWADCDIKDIIEKLRNARNTDDKDWNTRRAATLFIGAGCSISAGVPLAGKIVDENKEKYKQAFARAEKISTGKYVTYPEFMAQLDDRERHDIHLAYIENAKINWAHIAIIQLMRQGYIGRVITVNFDDLLIRAGAMLGFVPVVYDVTQLKDFNSFFVPKPAVFYIHGQHSGFSKIYTQKQDERNKKSIQEVLKNTIESSPTIVLGYSGESDPVFELLKEIQLTRSLYWLEYSDRPPKDHILPLLEKDNTFYLSNQDADQFLIELCQGLEAFPPKALTHPFSHLQKALDDLTEFPSKDSGRADFFNSLRQTLNKAIETFEPSNTSESEVSGSSLLEALLSDNPDEAIRAIEQLNHPIPENLKDAVAWAYISSANSLLSEVETRLDNEKDEIWNQIFNKYEQAVKIDPNKHEALNNWGLTLSSYATTKLDIEADKIWESAFEKFSQALKINQDDHIVINNWGVTLSDQANTKFGIEADEIRNQAIERFIQATQIKSDSSAYFYNWGNALTSKSEDKASTELANLLEEAIEKYNLAIQIDPNSFEVLCNLGITLVRQAQIKNDFEATKLRDQAIEKYILALEIKPNNPKILSSLGNALTEKAKNKDRQEANEILEKAIEKYLEATKSEPNNPEILHNWGKTLMEIANIRQGKEADVFREQAIEKFGQAIKVKPNDYKIFHSWGLIFDTQARLENELRVNPPHLAAFNNSAKINDLWEKAIEKYSRAVEIAPNNFRSLNNWGTILLFQISNKIGLQRQELLQKAREILTRHHVLEPTNSYNLACLEAISGNETECLKWLENCLTHKTLPSCQHLSTDTDLYSVRKTAWFQDFMLRAGCSE